MDLMQTFILGLVTALAGLVALLLWKAGARLLAALHEIARLPDAVQGIDATGAELVTELRGVINEMRAVARRVDRLEAFLPDSMRVHADLTLSNDKPKDRTP